MVALCLRASALLLIALLTAEVKAQFRQASVVAACNAAVRNHGLSEAAALAISQRPYHEANAFCTALSSGQLGSAAQSQAIAIANSLPLFSPSSGDCSLSLAIATCSASAVSNTRGSLGLSDSLAIAEGFGSSQAIAVCTAIADSGTATAQSAARSLLQACSKYRLGNPFRVDAESALYGLTPTHASAAARALANAGYDQAMAAAKACARAAGLSNGAINQEVQASASALASAGVLGGINDASAAAGSQASASHIGGIHSGFRDTSASAGSLASASNLGGNGASAAAGSSASVQTDPIGFRNEPFDGHLGIDNRRRPIIPSTRHHIGIHTGLSSVDRFRNNIINQYNRRRRW